MFMFGKKKQKSIQACELYIQNIYYKDSGPVDCVVFDYSPNVLTRQIV